MELTKWKVHGEIMVSNLSREDMANRVSAASALIKTMCGIGNNAAWSCCLEAMDHLRQHPNFRHHVKKGFNAAMEEFKQYERRLVYANENRLFHLGDLTPEFRKRYGNISDREYYDYWCSTGATAYAQKRTWAVNLWNKYRLSMLHHGVPHEDIVAWGMVGSASLRLAQCIYENNIEVAVQDHGIPKPLLEVLFGGLNIKTVADRWDAALPLIEPRTNGYELDDAEVLNIQLGMDQLAEEWTSMATMTDALTESTEAYNEIFRTQGEQKKALRLIAEMKD